ncbi:unnamed protein product, partial [Hapterophycus canaliculatus]
NEGVVTIEGADGTPGADWRVTIASSESEGGEYVVTEHRRDETSSPNGGNDHGCQQDGKEEGFCLERKGWRTSEAPDEAQWEEGSYSDNGERSAGNGGQMQGMGDPDAEDGRTCRTETLRHETMSAIMSIRLKEECSNAQPQEEDDSDNSEGRGQRRKEEVPREEGGRRQSTDQRGSDGEGTSKPTRSRDTEDKEAQEGNPGVQGVTGSESILNGRKEDSRQPTHTPTPPERKASSSPQLTSDQSGSGLASSAVTRFARWIVESAHIGGKKVGRADGSGGESRVGEKSIATDGDISPDGEEAAVAKEAAAAAAVPATGNTKKSRASTLRSSFVGRKGQASVKGFQPVRTARVSMTCPLPTKLARRSDRTEKEFDAPTFGTTVLGNSHGFDPKGNTSGYVLWINGRGYMIDPPPYASMILQAFNIRPSLIAGVIVTHCHADHDAGTFQKVLLDGQVNIISTRTIYESFIRKYTALSGMSADLIRSSHHFTPVTIGHTLRLNGASFDFFYTLHSIPCIGFEVTFKGKGIAFSADHMNDPARIRAMYEDGFLSEGRRDALLDFPWHHDIIFHEAGIPPIHTPMGTLLELPDDVKKRLYVVHVSESSIPKGSGLQVAPVGIENTIRLDTVANPHRETINLLELICSVGVLSDISVAQARSLLEVGELVKFEANTTIQHPNIDITNFAIICNGKASSTVFKEVGTRRSFGKQETELRRGDCYGEELLLEGSVRRRGYVTVRAVSNIEVLLFNGQDLDQILGLQAKRLEDTYRLDQLLVYNTVLCALSRKQILQLETFTEVKNFAAGEMVWTAGQPVERVVLVAKGKLAFVSGRTRELMSGSCPRDGQRMTGGEKPRLVFCPKAFLPGSLVGRAGTVLDPPGSNHYRYSLR